MEPIKLTFSEEQGVKLSFSEPGAFTLNMAEGIGTGNYNTLTNKPSIEGVTLENDKSFSDLGLKEIFDDYYSQAVAISTISPGATAGIGYRVGAQQGRKSAGTAQLYLRVINTSALTSGDTYDNVATITATAIRPSLASRLICNVGGGIFPGSIAVNGRVSITPNVDIPANSSIYINGTYIAATPLVASQSVAANQAMALTNSLEMMGLSTEDEI